MRREEKGRGEEGGEERGGMFAGKLQSPRGVGVREKAVL